MSIKFIDLIDASPTDEEYPRSSSLAYDYNNQPPGAVRVVGVLEHGSEIKPKSAADRDRLVKLLQAIDYDGTQPHSVSILWGECPEPDAEPVSRIFNTADELAAYMSGVEDCDGWAGYEVI